MELAAGMVEMPVKDSDIENADSNLKPTSMISVLVLICLFVFSHNPTVLESHKPADDDNKQCDATSSTAPIERWTNEHWEQQFNA